MGLRDSAAEGRPDCDWIDAFGVVHDCPGKRERRCAAGVLCERPNRPIARVAEAARCWWLIVDAARATAARTGYTGHLVPLIVEALSAYRRGNG